MLCPSNTMTAKLVNKFIKIILNPRKKLDDGHPLSTLTFPPMITSLESHDDSFNSNTDDSLSESDSDSSCKDA